MSLLQLHKLYIRGTANKALIVEKTVFLCNLTMAVFRNGYLPSAKIHVTTIMLKHLFDKKPAEEYEFLLYHLPKIVRFPDKIFRNKSSKRGSIIFVKNINADDYICSLESVTIVQPDGSEEELVFIATAFRNRNEKYLNGFELLWSWRGGTPSS